MADISGAASQTIASFLVPNDNLMKIHFLVVGGSPAGLACGISLCRAGHNVTLLAIEDEVEVAWGPHGVTVPPNLTKLLVRWGMGDKVKAKGTRSKRISMVDYHTGEPMGNHDWHEEVLKDSGGDIMYVHYNDIRTIMHECAVSYGVDIRTDVQVASISVPEETRPSVRLSSGEVIEADVIVGADGSKSAVRREILRQELRDTPMGLSIFNVRIPKEKLFADPKFADIYNEMDTALTWIGDGHAAIGLFAGDEYSLFVYTPTSGTEDLWGQDVSLPALLKSMGKCQPILVDLAKASFAIRCLPIGEPPEVDPWVHPDGRVVLVGDAAHPFPRGSTHGLAAAVCDAASLGEFFRHLHSDGQIDSFLLAYENIRRDRVKNLLQVDMANAFVIAMPAGEQKDQRDGAMKEKHAAGVDAFSADDGDVAAHWEMEKILFSYDAEEHAADWWNDWGLLNERATGSVPVRYDRAPVFQIRADVQAQEVFAGGV